VGERRRYSTWTSSSSSGSVRLPLRTSVRRVGFGLRPHIGSVPVWDKADKLYVDSVSWTRQNCQNLLAPQGVREDDCKSENKQGI
jgi:hypothetical protein